MTRQPGEMPARGLDEANAARVAADIARLRRNLQDKQLLAHPAVRDEVRKLDAQLVPYLDPTGSPGRHRSGVLRGHPASAGPQMEDVAGFSTKPNPLTATTAAEFMAALRQYRKWAGSPAYRRMAKRAGQVCVHSTMHAALIRDDLPRQEVMRAIVIGCEATPEDVRAFVTAWRRINSGQETNRTEGTGPLPAPVPAELALASS
jgi:hypothetical protein